MSNAARCSGTIGRLARDYLLRTRLPWWSRIAGAVLLLGGGWVHLHLWQVGYRTIEVVGPLFLADAVTSAGLAVALVATGGLVPVLATVLFEIGAIVGLIVASTVGLFGFHETGVGVGAYIVAAYAAEGGAVVSIAVGLAYRVGARR